MIRYQKDMDFYIKLIPVSEYIWLLGQIKFQTSLDVYKDTKTKSRMEVSVAIALCKGSTNFKKD